MLVRDIMTETAATVPHDATLREVASRMRDLDVGFLPVCDGERIVGTLTDRDLVIRALADDCGADTPASQVMTRAVVTCFDDDPIGKASAAMAVHQVRRLIVLDRAKKLVGVLSLGDVSTRAHEEHLSARALEGVSEDRARPG